MDDETLIERVRQHVELYDVSDKRYTDAAHKQCVWNEISQHLGHSAITCKTRWSNIRDNYRKSLKKRVTRSGLTGQPRNVRYKYENKLTFLLPFIRERDPNHSGPPIREGDEVLTEEEAKPPVKRDDNRDLQTRPPFANSVVNETDSHGEEPTAMRGKQSGREIPVESDSGFTTPESTRSNYSAESDEPKLQVALSVSHSVDVFLAGIAPTLKSLSPYNLNIAKTNIFSIVQEAEMIQIMQQQQQKEEYQPRKRRAISTSNESGTSPFSSPMYETTVSSP